MELVVEGVVEVDVGVVEELVVEGFVEVVAGVDVELVVEIVVDATEVDVELDVKIKMFLNNVSFE